MQREYKQEVKDEIADFNSTSRGCTCFINPPCSHCMHPANPHSIEAMGEDAYEPEKPINEITIWADSPEQQAKIVNDIRQVFNECKNEQIIEESIDELANIYEVPKANLTGVVKSHVVNFKLEVPGLGAWIKLVARRALKKASLQLWFAGEIYVKRNGKYTEKQWRKFAKKRDLKMSLWCRQIGYKTFSKVKK
jgi:hypothetical protein